MLDLDDGGLHRIFQDAGMYDAVHVSATAIAWLESSTPTDDGGFAQVHMAGRLVDSGVPCAVLPVCDSAQ